MTKTNRNRVDWGGLATFQTFDFNDLNRLSA